ncbi:glycerol-3-phosphate responsive antiterminator [Alkalibacter sp. M17DMB]|nr:glycerol-3-phosphate responsive antiterminator [Alkalibacter mobilis]
MEDIREVLKDYPIIPACRTKDQFKDALESEARIIFVLEANISDYKEKINAAKDRGKYSFIHFDLIGGLAQDDDALEYLKQTADPTGIITTRKNLIAKAKKLEMNTIQRMFLIDTTSIASAINMARQTKPDAIEIMPGIAPKVIRAIKNRVDIPIITGGLMTEEAEIRMAIKAGAVAASLSKKKLWNYKYGD